MMTEIDKKAVLTSPVGLLATWFGSGLFPKAPGTMGTIAALPFAWVVIEFGGPIMLLYAAIAISLIGVPISNAYMKQFKAEHDPKEIVIDEVAGMWLALSLLTLPVADNAFHYVPVLASFVLFRLFDIWKPWPISWADKKVSGGLGVMLDDILAGVIAALVGYGMLIGYYLVTCPGGDCAL